MVRQCCVHPGHCNQQFCYYKGARTSFYLLSCLIGSLILHKLQCLPPLENFLYLHHCVIWVSIPKKCSRGRNCASRNFANILSWLLCVFWRLLWWICGKTFHLGILSANSELKELKPLFLCIMRESEYWLMAQILSLSDVMLISSHCFLYQQPFSYLGSWETGIYSIEFVGMSRHLVGHELCPFWFGHLT
jgi:hypothetical protein